MIIVTNKNKETEVVYLANSYIESKGMVKNFLDDLKRILNDENLDFRILPRNDKKKEFTTNYCLRKLNYQTKDILKELRKLQVEDYLETCIDERNIKSNKYYIFGIDISKKSVYIKIKIQSYNEKIVLCMSFHFAEYELKKFPYR